MENNLVNVTSFLKYVFILVFNYNFNIKIKDMKVNK